MIKDYFLQAALWIHDHIYLNLIERATVRNQTGEHWGEERADELTELYVTYKHIGTALRGRPRFF